MCEKEEEVALPGLQIMGCLQSCPRSTCVHVPDQHKASDHDDICLVNIEIPIKRKSDRITVVNQ